MEQLMRADLAGYIVKLKLLGEKNPTFPLNKKLYITNRQY